MWGVGCRVQGVGFRGCRVGAGGHALRRSGVDEYQKFPSSCMLTTSHIFPGVWANGRCTGRGMMRLRCAADAFSCCAATAWPIFTALLPTDVLGGMVLGLVRTCGRPATTFGTESGTKCVVSERAAGCWGGGGKTACRRSLCGAGPPGQARGILP